MKPKHLTIVVFVAITLPLVVHTEQLLVKITPFATSYTWLKHAYALFFAIAFDLSVFHFAQLGQKKVSKVFAWIVLAVNFLYWNFDILFVRLPADPGNITSYALLLIGTLFSVIGAYLVYTCSELLATQGISSRPVRKAPAASRPNARTVRSVSAGKQNNKAHRGDGQDTEERIKTLRNGGHSIREIARITGISKSTVGDYVKQIN